MQSQIIILWKIFFLLGFTLATRNTFSATQLAPLRPPQNLRYAQNYASQPAQNRAVNQQLIPQKSNPFYAFSSKLFSLLGPPLAQTNLVFSPLSIQTMLSFIYTGANNETARELRAVLEIPESSEYVARQFQDLLQHLQQQSRNDLHLLMANKMYYSNFLHLNKEFYKIANSYFKAEMEPSDFTVPERAAFQINQWVAERTNQRIRNLISPNTLDAYTRAIIVNAIYLKAKWAKEFSTFDTEKSNFFTPQRAVSVDMMFTEDNFNFGELPSLNAKAIELPFDKSDLSMLILLPNEINGLTRLETDLSKVNLISLMNALRRETVILRLPKFRIDFELDMSESLKRLGLSRLFSQYAQLNRFFNNQTVSVSKVQHKVYINVNEGGVEAAAASFGKLTPLSLPARITYVNVDHPFIFIIRSPHAIFFIGHVVNP